MVFLFEYMKPKANIRITVEGIEIQSNKSGLKAHLH